MPGVGRVDQLGGGFIFHTWTYRDDRGCGLAGCGDSGCVTSSSKDRAAFSPRPGNVDAWLSGGQTPPQESEVQASTGGSESTTAAVEPAKAPQAGVSADSVVLPSVASAEERVTSFEMTAPLPSKAELDKSNAFVQAEEPAAKPPTGVVAAQTVTGVEPAGGTSRKSIWSALVPSMRAKTAQTDDAGFDDVALPEVPRPAKNPTAETTAVPSVADVAIAPHQYAASAGGEIREEVPLVHLRKPRRMVIPARFRSDVAGVLVWSLMLWMTYLWVQGYGLNGIDSVSSGLRSLGRLFGLWASALMLLQVFLMARVPVIEANYGQHALTKTHRTVGFMSFFFMMAHIVAIVAGYSAIEGGALGFLTEFTLHYPGGLVAVAGTVALCAVVATSIKAARASMRYETWHLIHVYAYLGAGLALPHQLWTGSSFTQNALASAMWWSAWIVVALAVVVFRIVRPIMRSRRAGLIVDEVREVGGGITEVVVRGSDVASLNPRGGQFMWWRFAGAQHSLRAHPYSLSAAPTTDRMRITVKCVGDDSLAVRDLPIGSRVSVEGPYGALHIDQARGSKMLMMASGIGVTPMMGMIDELPPESGAIVVYRTRSAQRDPLVAPLQNLCSKRDVHLVLAEGPRREFFSWLPDTVGDACDDEVLLRIAPDLAERTAFVCGSKGWADAATEALERAGVPRHATYVESFRE